MKNLTFAKLLVTIIFLGNMMIAHAVPFGSGGIWAGNQYSVICHLFNTGTDSININSKSVITEHNGAAPITGDTCGSIIQGQKLSLFYANVQPNGDNACLIDVSTIEHLRGRVEIRSVNGIPLISGELR